MIPAWEILIAREDFEDFSRLLEGYGCGGFTAASIGNDYWVICYPPKEVRTLAILRFNIKILPKFGTEVIFTDCPNSEDNLD